MEKYPAEETTPHLLANIVIPWKRLKRKRKEEMEGNIKKNVIIYIKIFGTDTPNCSSFL